MDFRVLGPLRAYADGEAVRLGGPKQRTVLALLIHGAGHAVSTDALINGVWGPDATGAAKSTLQSYIFNLRSALGDRLVTESGGYRLAADRDEVDALRFEDAVGRAAPLVGASPVDAATVLRDALAMWEGRPYADIAPSVTLEAEARRLDELRLKALADRVEAELALGRHAELVAELEVLTAEYPLSEQFRSQHMLALYRAGRQAEALRVYQRTRHFLADEMGLDPSPELQELERRILTQDPLLDLDTEPRVMTVTVLITELDQSGLLWELHAESMPRLLQLQEQIVGEVVANAGGRIFRRTGDGVSAAFDDVASAARAAEAAQRRLTAQDWRIEPPPDVRMAVDTGDVEEQDGDYVGPPLNRCARLLAAAHGRQIVLSGDTHNALAISGGAGWQVRALGEHRFRGLGREQPVFQLVVPGVDSEFPPLRTDRAPSLLPSLGRAVRGFELRERIGGGAFGVVYRAYQPSVGREAAVKVVRPELVNQTEFVQRFEAEAQVVAQLEHPHIVPLYDYWRDPDGAFLVTRWLRGGSLRAALDRRDPWELDATMTLVDQVGGALSYAHRHGVVHRDLKPSNVLLDEDGRAYVADFGITARPATVPAASPSPSGYIAPEELRGDPVTERTDVYGLGLLIAEVLTGRRPQAEGAPPTVSSTRPELPSAIDSVLARACADDPGDRYASVDELIDAVSEAADPVAAGVFPDDRTPVRTDARNPYKGLHAFQEADAADFYGRAALVDELNHALDERRLVALVGPSGIGKSSVVRAGLIPRLRRAGSDWLVTDLIPGAFPFEELARALLRVAVRRPDALADDLATGEITLAEAARQVLPGGCRALLVVDQFEELFTLTTDDEVRRRFLDDLTEVARDADAPLSVLVTLRADFLDRPLRYAELGELLAAGTVMVAAPSRPELIEAITRPAANVGVRFGPGLSERIAADVTDQPGGLPLLQYALTELFDTRSGDLITAIDYEAAGGVLGALGRRADELYAELDSTGHDAARQVFLRLVTVADAATQDTRRRVTRRELRGLALDPAVLDQVLDRFGAHRLLTFDRHQVTRAPTVEVAHEALLNRWERLRGWVDDRREELLLHRRLTASVDDWDASGEDPGYLLSSARLIQFEALAGTDLALSDRERTYLGSSRSAVNRQAARRRRVRRSLFGGLTVGLAAMTVLAAVALVSQQRADREADVARARELAAAAVAVLGDDPSLSKLLAVASADIADPSTETVAALHQAWAADLVVSRQPGPPHDMGPIYADADPSGARAVVAGWGDIDVGWNYLEVIDLETRDVEWAFVPELNSAVPGRPRFSPDGSHVVAGVIWNPRPWEDPNPPPEMVGAFVLDAGTGEPVVHYDLGPCGGFVDGVSMTHLLVKTLPGPAQENCDWFGDTGVELVDRRTGDRQVLTIDGLPWWDGAALSGDGRYVAYDDFDTGLARVVEVSTGSVVFELDSRPRFVRALNNDGSLLAYGDDPIEVWDVTSGELSASYPGHEGASFFATFHPSGASVYSTGEDGNLHHWDTATGRPITVLPNVGTLNVSTRGDTLLVARLEGTIARLDLGVRGQVGAIETCPGAVLRDSLKVTDRLAVFGIHCDGDPEATTYVADLDTLDVRYTVPGHGAQSLAISPDGTRFARQEADGTMHGPIAIRDLATGELLVTLNGLCTWNDADQITPLDELPGCRPYPETPFALWSDRLRWSPDGHLIAAPSRGGTVVWDVATGELVFAEQAGRSRFVVNAPDSGYAFDVIFSADSSRIIASGDSEMRVLSTDTGELEHRAVNNTIGGYAFGFLGFSPDGSTLLGEGRANGDPNGSLTWLDAETLEWVREVDPTHDAGVSSRAVSPDGSLVATGAADGLVRVWDEATGALVHEIPFGGTRVAGVAFVNDSHVTVTLDGGDLIILTIDPIELLEIVRSSLTRGFTDAECARFNFGDDCPTLAELRGPPPGADLLNGTFHLEWTMDGLVEALVQAFPDEVSEEFAEIAWSEAFDLQRPGAHSLSFRDGRWDHTVTSEDVEWMCTGTFSVRDGRVELVPERGICGLSRAFDSEFELDGGELRFIDYHGQPLERIIYAARPWQRAD